LKAFNDAVLLLKAGLGALVDAYPVSNGIEVMMKAMRVLAATILRRSFNLIISLYILLIIA